MLTNLLLLKIQKVLCLQNWVNQFFVNVFEDQDKSFVFSDKFVLLDAEQRIRGYYVATSFEEVKKLSEELKVLITEELRKIKAEF